MTLLNSAERMVFADALPPLPAQPDDVAWPTGAWPEGQPDEGVDRDRLRALLDTAFDDPQPEAFGLSLACVVVHRGRIIAERYGPETTAKTPLTSWSTAKSVTHAAIGLLVGDGLVQLEAPAPVPEWANPEDPRHAITVRDLLHMRSGLEFNEDYVGGTVDGDGSEAGGSTTSHCLEMLFGSGRADMAAFAASQQLLHPPGTVFNYSSGTTNILARIVADVVGHGDAFRDWLHDRLLRPLGMHDAEPRFDDAGCFVGSSYLYATARDFARFGLLYLRDGVWDDQRLLPEGWVDFARTPVAIDDDDSHYGAHWWVPYPARGVFAAQGYETQRILVIPDADAVIVRLGKTVIDLAPNVVAWQGEMVDCFERRR